MEMRLLPIRVGARARTRAAYPYDLPAGLGPNAEVEVLSYDKHTYNHVVRDAVGHEWTIQALQNLDAGCEYRLDGHWLPSHDLRVAAELQRRGPEKPAY
jgi:hypothetical protein